MKKSFVLLTFLVVMFGLYGLKEVNACCSHALISIPDAIGKTSVLNSFASLPFVKCDSGSMEITLVDESSPITVQRELIAAGTSESPSPSYIVRLTKEGGWGDRSILKVPLEALCLDGASNIPTETKYMTVNISESVYTVAKVNPEILSVSKSFEKTPSSQYYTGNYAVTLSFEVEPVCPECVYRVYMSQGEENDPYRKTYTYHTMLIKDKESEKYYFDFNINDVHTAYNCGLYCNIANEDLCNGLWFAIQIEDSYGNVSEVSEEYRFMPPQEHIDKYCSTSDAGSSTGDAQDIPRGDTGQTTDAGSNVNINSSNSDSGGCSILTLE